MSNKKFFTVQQTTTTAILAACVIILCFLPLRTLGLEINFSMVPVAVGAILFGPLSGLLLGAVFGIASFSQAFGYSTFGAMMLSESPIFTAITCIPTRMLAGLLVSVLYRVICGHSENDSIRQKIALPVVTLAAPLLNTIFFMTALVLCFYNGATVQGYVEQLHAANPFIFVILFVGINGAVEIAAGFFVAFPVAKAMLKILR